MEGRGAQEGEGVRGAFHGTRAGPGQGRLDLRGGGGGLWARDWGLGAAVARATRQRAAMVGPTVGPMVGPVTVAPMAPYCTGWWVGWLYIGANKCHLDTWVPGWRGAMHSHSSPHTYHTPTLNTPHTPT